MLRHSTVLLATLAAVAVCGTANASGKIYSGILQIAGPRARFREQNSPVGHLRTA
jgi:hypothetical protein